MNDTINKRRWNEQWAAERNYSEAVACLKDAFLISGEREFYGVRCLVGQALRCIKALGIITETNGQKKLEVQP